MAFKFTQNIKVAVVCTDGELVFEFRRPSNKDKNQFFMQQLDVKSEGAQKLDDLDELRLAFYDKFIYLVYMERDGNKEDVIDENEKIMRPADYPDDLKVKAVFRAFESGGVVAKNF